MRAKRIVGKIIMLAIMAVCVSMVFVRNSIQGEAAGGSAYIGGSADVVENVDAGENADVGGNADAGGNIADTGSSGRYNKESDSMYGIGSVSKIITAGGVMKLCDLGLLDLDEPVITYLPEFTMEDERYQWITVRMLLNHSSGLSGMTDHNAQLLNDNSTYAHDVLLKELSNQVLKHAPGERSIYCNDGFTLAEILIEKVSGMDFTEFITESLFMPLGITDIVSPQSEFDRTRLVPMTYGNLTLKEETLNLIGSGGFYATANDLCLFMQIFTEDCSILSEQSKEAMMQMEHVGAFWEEGADSTIAFGLGFDSVDTYPFENYGIKAVSKGGSTAFYHSNVTMLPQCNLSVAVLSSGESSFEQLIAQEIILAVLEEEGIIPHTEISMPVYDQASQIIDEKWMEYGGLYGGMQLMEISFEEENLVITLIGGKNNRAFRFAHIGNGDFVSQDGDYIGMGSLLAAEGGNTGISKVRFVENELGEQFLYADSYMEVAGLSKTALSLPLAQKIEKNEVSMSVLQAWTDRAGKNYLLVNETASSSQYIHSPVAKLYTDDSGYLQQGVYEAAGFGINSVKIISETEAAPYQATPVHVGRDSNWITVINIEGREYLDIRGYRFLEEDNIKMASEITDSVRIPDSGDTVWFALNDMDEARWELDIPENGSYFVYDEDYICIGSSLEKEESNVIVLPQKGYIAFAGAAGDVFWVGES